MWRTPMNPRTLLLPTLAVALMAGAWLLARDRWQEYHRVDIEDTHTAIDTGSPDDILPLHELLARLALAPGTRIVEIEQEAEHGAFVYEIEILEPDGRVRELLIDARNARILGEEHPSVEMEESHHAPATGGG